MSDVRPIPFAPGYYVSDEGCVLSEKKGVMKSMRPWSNRGYPMVTLRIGGASKKMLVHRLTALVFIGSPPTSRHEVLHGDGNPGNGHVANLSWGTHAENAADMVRHGRVWAINCPEKLARGATHGSRTHPERVPRGDANGMRRHPEAAARGERHPSAKLTADKVRNIRLRVLSGEPMRALAGEYGVSPGLIYNVSKRTCWKHVA